MDRSLLQTMPAEQRDAFSTTLIADAFFVPVLDIKIDKSSGAMHVAYMHTEVRAAVGIVRYLPIFSRQSYWRRLDIEAAGLVQPPLQYLLDSLSDPPLVLDLGSPQPVTTTVGTLISLRRHILTSASAEST